ncbi:MAG: hypothetical protein ACI8Q2_000829 [Candidatus Omnitrophota bacterium]|jgi:hypothetical protein
MFFWESLDNTGFVFLPQWIENLYDSLFGALSIFAFFVAGLAAVSFIYCGVILLKDIRFLLNGSDSYKSKRVITIFWTFLIIIPYVGLFSLFYILHRYILMTAILCVVLIAVFLNDVLKSKNSKYIST